MAGGVATLFGVAGVCENGWLGGAVVVACVVCVVGTGDAGRVGVLMGCWGATGLIEESALATDVS